MLQIYNTLSRKKEIFTPLSQHEVKVYFCGPTPYNFAHIGNLKAYIVNDYIIKTLRFLGYKVTTTMNITDIDDKTIRDSQAAGESLLDFTKKYSDYFLDDLQKLGVQYADNIAPISGLVDEMIEMIQGLLDKGYAYLADDGSVYYDISKFATYGELAHLDMKGMKSSVRIDNDEYEKDDVADFVLWKAWRESDGPNKWEATFTIDGEERTLIGRPGWHIECSACNKKYFGAQIDIHMGGIDNIFPHHQNEIAQSEAYFGKTFSKYWIHGGHITVDGKKMAKSANNFYTLRDIEQKYENIDPSVLYRAIRLSFMNAKYRDNVDFSFSKVEQNIQNIKKIDETLKSLLRVLHDPNTPSGKTRREFSDTLQGYIGSFVSALEDDFGMCVALSSFFKFMTFTNSYIQDRNHIKSELQNIFDMFKTYNEVLSIVRFEFKKEVIDQDILEIFEKRNQAKLQKDFATADTLRYELLEKGYKIIDEKSGSRLERIK